MKQIYKWHKRIGLIVAIPVILWTLSGLLHPIMGWIKPEIKHRSYTPEKIDLSTINSSFIDSLTSLDIQNFSNIHIASFENKRYLQIKDKNGYRYFNVRTAKEHTNAENEYVQFLARHFSGDIGSEIKSVTTINAYNSEYKAINRLLPVHRVEFDREDGYTIFIEASTGRLAGVVDSKRYAFNVFFEWFHNFDFLPNTTLRNVIIYILMILTMLAACAGLYIYFKTNKTLGERGKLSFDKRKERNYHRKISLFFSLSLLCFALSGGYHLFKKKSPYERLEYSIEPSFLTSVIKNFPQKSVHNIGIVKIDGKNYFQLLFKEGRNERIEYVDAVTHDPLKDGDEHYAKYLAQHYFGIDNKDITNVQKITKFKGEYGFINKRLPVQKVKTNLEGNDRYYIETKTSKLGAHVVDSDMLEGLSFAYLHKYHMFDILGKDLRNVVMMLFALGNLVIIFSGVRILLKRK